MFNASVNTKPLNAKVSFNKPLTILEDNVEAKESVSSR